ATGRARPAKRPLKIFAFDPMLARLDSTRVISIKVPNEPLRPCPEGTRMEVIEYAGVNKCLYPGIDLDDPRVLMRGGLDPAEADPRFHQQMVYAVTMKTIENFDFALGRGHGLRRHFRAPSKPDVYAFHEGFSDIVAIFQHFSFDGVLRDEIQRTRTDLLSQSSPLAELARQFGHATGRGQALRRC